MGILSTITGGDLLGVGSSLLTSAINSLVGVNQAEVNRAYNSAEAQKQREWQEKMWNLSNEYNNPKQVIQRLREAGLSPALAYGGDATTLAAHVGNGSAAHSQGYNIPVVDNPINAALAIRKNQAEIDLIESQELKNREEAKNLTEAREGMWIENSWKRDSYQLRLDALEAENNLKAQLASTEVSKRNEIQSNVEWLAKQGEFADFEMWNKERLTDKEMQEIDNRMANANKVTAQTIATMKSEERKNYADAWLAEIQVQIQNDPRYKEAKIQQAVNEAYKSMMEGNIKSVEYRLRVLEEEMKPKPGEKGFKFARFCEIWIGSFTRPVGYLLGGNVGISKRLE